MNDKKIRNLTVVIEHTGERILNLDISASKSANDLISLLPQAIKDKFPPKVRFVLTHKRSHKQMIPTQSFESLNVKDNDVLILDIERTAGGGMAVNSFRDIQIINSYLSHNLVSSYHHFALYAIILYTDADKELANFIRTNFLELHNLSGSHCAFYIIERPEPEWLPSIRKELSLGSYSEKVWHILEKKQFTPVDSASIYEIAQRFNIKRSQLPCIAFFSNLDSKELLVVPFETLIDIKSGSTSHQDFLKLFRSLFDKVDISVQKAEGDRLKILKEEIAWLKRSRTLTLIENIALPETVKSLIGVVIKFIIA